MKTKVIIELLVDGDPSDVAQALDLALDEGVLQDAINEYEDATLEVESAVVTTCEKDEE